MNTLFVRFLDDLEKLVIGLEVDAEGLSRLLYSSMTEIVLVLQSAGHALFFAEAEVGVFLKEDAEVIFSYEILDADVLVVRWERWYISDELNKLLCLPRAVWEEVLEDSEKLGLLQVGQNDPFHLVEAPADRGLEVFLSERPRGVQLEARRPLFKAPRGLAHPSAGSEAAKLLPGALLSLVALLERI